MVPKTLHFDNRNNASVGRGWLRIRPTSWGSHRRGGGPDTVHVSGRVLLLTINCFIFRQYQGRAGAFLRSEPMRYVASLLGSVWTIKVLPDGTCRCLSISSPCGQLGDRLLSLPGAKEASFQFDFDPDTKLEVLSALSDSLRRAGFKRTATVTNEFF